MSERSDTSLYPPRQHQVIGIVGGMGPFSHLDVERKVLEAARDLVGVTSEQDFPEWVLSSIPATPDRTLAMEGRAPDPMPWLLRSLRRLEGGRTASGHEIPGADFAILACNTAHHYLPRLREASSIPILDMVEETARFIHEYHEGARVGLLATTGTLEARLYHDALEAFGLRPVSLQDLVNGETLQEHLVMEPLYGRLEARGGRGATGIKALGPKPQHKKALEDAAKILIETLGADVVVSGCTELAMTLTEPSIWGRRLVDPTRVLARAAVRRAYGLRKMRPGRPVADLATFRAAREAVPEAAST